MRAYRWCIIIMLFIVLSGCTDYTSDEHEFSSNPINNSETGFILKDNDGWIYYQDGENSNNISRIKGSTKETFSDTYGMNINIYDDYLYFRDFGKGANLVRLELSNPDNREILTDVNTYQSIIINGMIYTNIIDLEGNKDGLYRINLDGSKKTRLVKDSINHIQFEKNDIFYCSQSRGQLFKIDLNGKNKKAVLIEDTGEYIATTHFVVDQGWIYFDNVNHDGDHDGAVKSDLGLCRVRTDGTDFEELVSGRISNLYTMNDQKYLLYTSDDELFMMNLETKETELLYSGEISFVNVLEDEIYILDWQHETKKSVIHKIDMKDRN